jgi:hypothetical protein
LCAISTASTSRKPSRRWPAWHLIGHRLPPKKTASEPDDGQAIALRTRTVSRSIAGTLAESYLRQPPPLGRGLTIDEGLSHCVRFHAFTPWQDGDDSLRVPIFYCPANIYHVTFIKFSYFVDVIFV